jgi:hypothetical protein
MVAHLCVVTKFVHRHSPGKHRPDLTAAHATGNTNSKSNLTNATVSNKDKVITAHIALTVEQVSTIGDPRCRRHFLDYLDLYNYAAIYMVPYTEQIIPYRKPRRTPEKWEVLIRIV